MSSLESERQLPLRVLYTCNTSPQYVLARSPSNVPVTIVHNAVGEGSQSTPAQVYGRTSLQMCAITLCQSSPEVLPDMTKDFSVYILDPLEDISSRARHGAGTGGVAVGMGLLSTILAGPAEYSMQVTGTIIGGDASDATLEVVISLRQVQTAPAFMPHIPNPMQFPQSSKGSKSKQSLFATHPLPSFGERLSKKVEQAIGASQAAYHMPPGPFNPYFYGSHPAFMGQMPPGNYPYPMPPSKKPDPAANTLAALMPTPYIGPPRRPPGRPRRSPSPSRIIEIHDTPKPDDAEINETLSIPPPPQPDNLPSEMIPFSSDASDADADVSSCSTPEVQCPMLPETSTAAQNTSILGALSAVSAPKMNLEGIPDGSHNPELVNLLKLYLAAIEKQGESRAGTSTSSSGSVPPGAPGVSGNVASGKENSNPSPPSNRIMTKNAEPARTNTALNGIVPLGSSAINTKVQPAVTAEQGVQGGVNAEKGRKRRLSDCAERESQALANSRRKTIPEKRSQSALQLGFRRDSGTSGQNSLGATSTRPSSFLQPPPDLPLFRPVGASQNVRKGPFVVPEWARVARTSSSTLAEGPAAAKDNASKNERVRKTKSLGRLGGKGRTVSSGPSLRQVGNNVKGKQKQTENTDLSVVSSKSALVVPPALTAAASVRPSAPRLPFIAQSSPVASSSRTSFFRQFDTSPCRPTRERTSSNEHPPTTPYRSSAMEESSSPLFTPSPAAITGGRRSLLNTPRNAPGLQVPPSPTPTFRLRKEIPVPSPLRGNRTAPLQKQPESEGEDSDCMSNSLPIASDDDFEFKRPKTPTTPRRRPNWRDMDLPPSSPPRTSSPMMESVALPVVSSDSAQVEDSGDSFGTLSSDQMPSTPRREDNHQNIFSNVNGWNFAEDYDFSESSNLFSAVNMNMGANDITSMAPITPSTKAVLDALQNGLGGEDLTEAWNLMSSMANPPASTGEKDDILAEWVTMSDDGTAMWFGNNDDGSSKTDSASQSSDSSTMESSHATGEIEGAITMAKNFGDLLEGCLV